MAASPFSALIPELLAAVTDHVPLLYRPQTILALALTSRRFCEIVVPHVLYRDVKLTGEAQAKEVLERLIEDARKCDGSGAEVSKGQCIRRLLLVAEKTHSKTKETEEDGEVGEDGEECEDEEEEGDEGSEAASEEPEGSDTDDEAPTTPTSEAFEPAADDATDTEPNVLQLIHTLISAGGLPNLRSLWIDLSEGCQWNADIGKRVSFPDLGDAFWADLRAQCHSLREVRITNTNTNLDGLRGGDVEHWTAPAALLDFNIISIRLQGHSVCHGFFFQAPDTLGATGLAERLEVLELRDRADADDIRDALGEAASGALCNVHMPCLRALIIEGAGEQTSATELSRFWDRHPLLERVEMVHWEDPAWFKGFAAGMLPNLTTLNICAAMAPLILPFVGLQLVTLDLSDTQGAQGAYFLRTSTPGGTFPQLRSLGIQLIARHELHPIPGKLWHERSGDPDGFQVFGAEYLASIARAAPRLEALELLGPSADDDLTSLTSGLLAMPTLRHFGFSSAGDYTQRPFFVASRLWCEDETKTRTRVVPAYFVPAHGAYAPTSFEQAARGVLEACAHLETVSCMSQMGEWLKTDRTVRAVRGEGTLRTVVGRSKGRVIRREEEW